MITLVKILYYWLHQKSLRLFSNIFSRKLPVENFDNVLVLSPHPDDEVFGCSYLINELKKSGKLVNLVIMSKGEKGCNTISKDLTIQYRYQMAIKANNLLGLIIENIYFLDFPDGTFKSTINDEYYINQIESLLENVSPQYVFIPHPLENSPDHEAATELLNKILQHKNIEKYYYCVWVWHHMRINKIFSLNFRRSYTIKGDKKLKQKAINEYIRIKTEDNIPISGNFPIMFLDMFKWNKELYFKD